MRWNFINEHSYYLSYIKDNKTCFLSIYMGDGSNALKRNDRFITFFVNNSELTDTKKLFSVIRQTSWCTEDFANQFVKLFKRHSEPWTKTKLICSNLLCKYIKL